MLPYLATYSSCIVVETRMSLSTHVMIALLRSIKAWWGGASFVINHTPKYFQDT